MSPTQVGHFGEVRGCRRSAKISTLESDNAITNPNILKLELITGLELQTEPKSVHSTMRNYKIHVQCHVQDKSDYSNESKIDLLISLLTVHKEVTGGRIAQQQQNKTFPNNIHSLYVQIFACQSIM